MKNLKEVLNKMVGYEELSPEQIIYLGNLALYISLIIVSGWIIRSLVQWRTARYIHLRIEKEIVASINKDLIVKKPFVFRIKDWLAKRKLKKEEKLLGELR